MQQNSGRASLSNYERRRRCCGEEGRQGHRVRPPLPPLPLYRCIRGGEGAALPLPPRKGCGQGGEESILPKAPRRCLPLFGLSPLQVSLAHGPLGLVPLDHVGQGAPPIALVAPRGRWTPGTPPVVLVQYR